MKQFHFYQAGPGPARHPLMVYKCPVCGIPHAVRINSPEGRSWKWNGNKEKPTIVPIFEANSGRGVCRTEIKDGQVHYRGKIFDVEMTEGNE